MNEHNEFPDKPVFFTPGTKKCLCISTPCILIAVLLLLALLGGNTSIVVLIGLAITATLGILPLYACVSEYITDCKHYRQSPEAFAEYKAKRFAELQKIGQEQQQQYEDMKKRMEEEQREKQEAKNRVAPCPICGKTDKVVRVSTLNRSASVAAFGLASSKIGKQYHCKHCDHLF